MSKYLILLLQERCEKIQFKSGHPVCSIFNFRISICKTPNHFNSIIHEESVTFFIYLVELGGTIYLHLKVFVSHDRWSFLARALWD